MSPENASFVASLEQLYSSSPLGVMLFQQDSHAKWQLIWSNTVAQRQLPIDTLVDQMEIKLELYAASKSHDSSSFDYHGFHLNLLPILDAVQTTILVHASPLIHHHAHVSLDEYSLKDAPKSQWNISDFDVLANSKTAKTESHSLPAGKESKQQHFLQSSQNFYQQVLKVANLSSFLCNKNSKYLIWDRQTLLTLELPQSLFNKESNGFYGCDFDLFLSFVHEEEKREVCDAFQVLWEHDWAFSIKFRLRAKDHSYQWFDLRVEAFDNHYVGCLTNVNEQMRFKRQLNAREKLIEQLIDGLPIGIVVKDAQSCYRFVNHQVEQDFNLSRAEIIGRTDFEVFNNPEILQEVLSTKEPLLVGQLQIEEKSVSILNHTEWFMVGRLSMKVENIEGRIEIWSMSFYLNITQRKLIEEELKEANFKALAAAQAKSDFLSVMSHEIRTPLNSVIGNAALLQDLALSEAQAPHVKMIQQSGEHLLYLINDILDFNKLEAGKVDLEHQPLNLAEQLKSCVQMTRSPAEANHVQLSLKVASEVPQWVQGDAGRLRQVLLNLLGNAVKFAKDATVSLLVSSELSELNLEDSLVETLQLGDELPADTSLVYFVIRDTGIGIEAESISKLFQEFSQANAGTSRQYGGTGLGLAICKKLVEAMGGAIGVASRLGEGSDFAFVLPLQKAQETLEYVSSGDGINWQQAFETQQSLHLLVAEDNLPNQFLIKAILKKLGHTLDLASDGKQALDKVIESNASGNRYDLILMDLAMPEMDGLQATKAIRAMQKQGILENYADVLPIIALTANALNEQKDAVEEAQMDDFLTKPIDIEKLKQVLYLWSHALH